MDPITIGLAGAQAIGGIYSMIDGAQRQKLADRALRAAMANRPGYRISEQAKMGLADAQSRAGAISPAVIAARMQAQQGLSNVMGNASRNAASGSQALATADAGYGAYNQQGLQLGALQQQYADQARAELIQARSLMANEEAKVQAEKQAASEMQMNYELGKLGAASNGIGQGLGMVAGAAANFAGSDYARRKTAPLLGNTAVSMPVPALASVERTVPFQTPLSTVAPVGMRQQMYGLGPWAPYRTGYGV